MELTKLNKSLLNKIVVKIVKIILII